jgi:hypothetical protein
MYISVDENNVIVAVSDIAFRQPGQKTVEIDLPRGADPHKLIGTKLKAGRKSVRDLRVAFVCNWGDHCGIATYTGFLHRAMAPKVKEIKIFSEVTPVETQDGPDVVRCWRRGAPVRDLLKAIAEYKPDFVIVQHEFGIFPKATYFLQLLQGLAVNYYVVVTQRVRTPGQVGLHRRHQEHRRPQRRGDGVPAASWGTTTTSSSSRTGAWYPPEQRTELWNIFQTPYALVQFGFGFFYKGVDRVLDAVHHLKNQPAGKVRGNLLLLPVQRERPHQRGPQRSTTATS